MKALMQKRSYLLRRNRRVLSVPLLLTTLAACQKNYMDEPVADAGSASTEQVSAKAFLGLGSLIWQEDADGSNFLNTLISKQSTTSYGMTASNNEAFNGSRSTRFELRDTDRETKGGTRTEISFPIPSTNNFWYSYAMYMPGAQYKDERLDEVISQWHGGGGLTPAICLRVTSGHLTLRVNDGDKGDFSVTDLGEIEKDKWHTYVFHIIHSAGSSGLIEVWIDDEKVVTRKGSNMYDLGGSFHLPNWKLGIYKSAWNGSSTTATKLRVLYFDDIKYGSSSASYSEMVPVGGNDSRNSAEPPKASISVTSFNLVSATAEKEIQTISNGASISLSESDLERVNIRAVTNGTVGRVQFELNGRESNSYTDEKAPFALHGDDGRGNYWYGNWDPPATGTYTLKATPYDPDGRAGESKTITFTFTR